MFCDCGEEITQNSWQKSLKLRKDKILCQSCLDIWAEGKNLATKNGRPMKRLKTNICLENPKLSKTALAKKLGCHRNTIYRRLQTDEYFKRLWKEAKFKDWQRKERILKLSKLFFEKLDSLTDSQMKEIYQLLKKF